MTTTLRAFVLAALMPVAAWAAEPAHAPAFTAAQRTEIVQIMRDAMRSDPSILRDAVAALQTDESARETAEAKGAIVARQKDLLSSAGDPEAGNPHGDITVVEFYDPRCPYCRRMLPGIEALLQKDRGIRLVYKDIPVLGAPSVMESRAIVAAAGQGGYLKMQAAIMKDPAQPSEAMIRATATAQGLNADKLAADMNSTTVTKKIDANLELAHALKVQGTPAFVVGDQMIPGMVDADQLEAAVTAARKHA